VPERVLFARRDRGQDQGLGDWRRRLFDQAVPQGRTCRAHPGHRTALERHAQSVVATGDLIVNLDQKTVEVAGARVRLTGKEYQMLELLSLRRGTTLTKDMFLTHLYGGMDEPELKIIDVFMCKLRGYVLREPDVDTDLPRILVRQQSGAVSRLRR
jgi:DNA-binding response OmpR family regulator